MTPDARELEKALEQAKADGATGAIVHPEAEEALNELLDIQSFEFLAPARTTRRSWRFGHPKRTTLRSPAEADRRRNRRRNARRSAARNRR